jgi:hypothetical protein
LGVGGKSQIVKVKGRKKKENEREKARIFKSGKQK